ncbi:MAG: hypothetical protein EHM70_05945 [Chloroflexota bacterium]|nr:MAG: hypothetical protein EHM70_05945 [Chloroflexota bacterium]
MKGRPLVMERQDSVCTQKNPLQILFGVALGIFMGQVAVNVISYFQKVLRRPVLASRAVLTPLELHETTQTRAVAIAESNLLAGVERRMLTTGEEKWVLNAGLRNFREPWARDFGFASYGLLALRQYEVVRENLEVFLTYQTSVGQFPIKVHSTRVAERYVHSLLKREQPNDTPIRPKYVTAHHTISLDGNGLLVIAALNYIRQSADHDFLRKHWDAIKRALTWLESFSDQSDGLLRQGAFSDWADSIARQGRVLYTNVIYWKALHEMAEAAKEFGYPHDQAYFSNKARQIRDAINAHFWRPDRGYFITSGRFQNLSSSGNLLAIAWDLADSQQANSILDAMHAYRMADPVPTQVVHPAYPSRFIAIENRIAGVGHYHMQAAWLWIGAWHVIALAKMGRLDQAQELFNRIAAVIARDGEVHEVYGTDGRYISGTWYTSEAPLTWSAGMFVYSGHLLENYS